MTIDSSLSTPRDRVRFNIGDTDESLISNQTIDALLVINNNSEEQTTLDCLKAIVADLAKFIDQEVGDVEIELSQRYEHYRQLYDDLTKDPSKMLNKANFEFGGTSKAEANRVCSNSDSRNGGLTEGFFTDTSKNRSATGSFFFNGD